MGLTPPGGLENYFSDILLEGAFSLFEVEVDILGAIQMDCGLCGQQWEVIQHAKKVFSDSLWLVACPFRLVILYLPAVGQVTSLDIFVVS